MERQINLHLNLVTLTSKILKFIIVTYFVLCVDFLWFFSHSLKSDYVALIFKWEKSFSTIWFDIAYVNIAFVKFFGIFLLSDKLCELKLFLVFYKIPLTSAV